MRINFSQRSAVLRSAIIVVGFVACTRNPSPRGEALASSESPIAPTNARASDLRDADGGREVLMPPGDASACSGGPGVTCARFATGEAAFRAVVAHDPAVLAIGEAHAQRGTERVTSATKRFTTNLLPLIADRTSEVVVEAWAGDPSCQVAVRAVASAQAPVKAAQAATNPNEYVELGTRAKALGVVPHLLRPTCADYARLADAGADDVVPESLALIKRLTQALVLRFFERNEATQSGKLVVTYGGAMHNDRRPTGELAAYSFGPALDQATRGRYVELDLIVPEYISESDVWTKLPWVPAWRADPGPKNAATLYTLGARSFVLVFPAAPSP